MCARRETIAIRHALNGGDDRSLAPRRCIGHKAVSHTKDATTCSSPQKQKLSTHTASPVMAAKAHWDTRASGCKFQKIPDGLNAAIATASTSTKTLKAKPRRQQITAIFDSYDVPEKPETDMDINVKTAGFSIAAIGLGGIGLFVALLVMYAGPFAPQQDVGTTIGEIAGNMRAAAWRSFFGLEQPESTIVQRAWDIDRVLMAAAPAAGVLGIVMAIVAYIRKEPKRMAYYGMALSVCAVFVQVLLIVLMIVAGVILLINIIQNMDSIFG